jgi:hypothetical protein
MSGAARTIASGILGTTFCVGCVLVGIYPHRPATMRGWVVLLLVAVPIVIAYDRIGEKLFSTSRGNRMSRSTRIIYGVATGIVVIAVSWLLLHMARPYLTG